jgi:TetR/AcrR family transcriptional regulator, mexJK operon transcriptional repressor
MNTQPAPAIPRRAKRTAPRRGRPLDAAQHRRIMAAATEAFLKRGFNATSMDLVARRAGVSKVTIYTHFTSKEALFAAIIDVLAGSLVARIEELELGDHPPGPALRQFGRKYLELALAASSVALHRVIVAEAARAPQLGRLIFEYGPVQIVNALARFLRSRKDLDLPDPRLAAEQFLGMVLGHAQLRLLLNARPAAEVRGSIAKVVDHAVEIFLSGVHASARNPLT